MKPSRPKPTTRGIKVPANLFLPGRCADPIPSKFLMKDVRRTEQVLGVRLPAAYVAVLKVCNGGCLSRNRIVPLQRPPRDYCRSSEYAVGFIDGIRSNHSTQTETLNGNVVAARRVWGLPLALVPFDGDGHNWLCLDYRRCGPRGEPTITDTLDAVRDGEPPVELRVAKSFADFLSRLERDKSEPSAAIALDKASVRGQKLAKILRSIGCHQQAQIRAPRGCDKPGPAWVWPKHKGPEPRNGAFLIVEKNWGENAWPRFTARPKGHTILRVDTKPRSHKPCVAQLLEALGPGATLLALDSPGFELDPE